MKEAQTEVKIRYTQYFLSIPTLFLSVFYFYSARTFDFFLSYAGYG